MIRKLKFQNLTDVNLQIDESIPFDHVVIGFDGENKVAIIVGAPDRSKRPNVSTTEITGESIRETLDNGLAQDSVQEIGPWNQSGAMKLRNDEELA